MQFSGQGSVRVIYKMPKKIYPWEFWAIPKFIQADPKLTATDKDVMAVFITRMNGQNFLKVKIQTVAEDLNVSIKSVQRAVKNLEKRGFLDVKRYGTNVCNQYQIKL